MLAARYGHPHQGYDWYKYLLVEESELATYLVEKPKTIVDWGLESLRVIIEVADFNWEASRVALDRTSQKLVDLFSGRTGRFIEGVLDFFQDEEPRQRYSAHPNTNCEEERYNTPPFGDLNEDTGIFWKKVEFSLVEEVSLDVLYGGIKHPMKRTLTKIGWTCIPSAIQIERMVSQIGWSDAENFCPDIEDQELCDLYNNWQRNSEQSQGSSAATSTPEPNSTPIPTEPYLRPPDWLSLDCSEDGRNVVATWAQADTNLPPERVLYRLRGGPAPLGNDWQRYSIKPNIHGLSSTSATVTIEPNTAYEFKIRVTDTRWPDAGLHTEFTLAAESITCVPR